MKKLINNSYKFKLYIIISNMKIDDISKTFHEKVDMYKVILHQKVKKYFLQNVAKHL